jgi:hypothetical protein
MCNAVEDSVFPYLNVVGTGQLQSMQASYVANCTRLG